MSFFDERSAMAKVDTTSMLARSFGKCNSPMCLPIGNIMETIKNMDEYKKLYQRSTNDAEGFWGEMAEQLDWY